MPIRYECDRCAEPAISHVRLVRETPSGTPIGSSDYWFCQRHLHQFNAAIAEGGESQRKASPVSSKGGNHA